MKPPKFGYHAPDSLVEAVRLLHDLGAEAKVLAGGQSLVPMLNLRLARPEHLVDLRRVGSLREIREADAGLSVGAMTTHRDIESSPLVRERCPILAEAVRWVAHPPIRVRGTVGGSLAHADPAAELPAVMRLLDAELVAQGPNRQRVIPAADFFVSYLTSALEPDEVLTEVRLPKWPEGAEWSFQEVSRRHGDFAIAGVATLLRKNGEDVDGLRIALFGVDARPVRATGAEAFAAGKKCGPELWAEVARQATAPLQPPNDLHGSGSFRKRVASVLVERALTEIVGEN